MVRPAVVLAVLLAAGAGCQTAEQLNFLTGLTEFRDLRDMLPAYLRGKAADLLAQRRQVVARFSSAQDLAQRRQYVRARMLAALGGLPERTPLNPRVVGVIEREDYRIEKIVFESQPRFYVTANLYLPKKGQPPYPAILYPLGHEAGAKAHTAWQQMLGALAKKGFVGLAWDPAGQGERSQFWDEDLNASKLGASTVEHTMVGIQCLLAGDNLARYTIWDGMRALDYLLSRREVDAGRVGVTGNSGGGTHTAYLAALEDRLHVAAPSCYLTSWGQLLRTIGPQDAEQCLPPWLADGLDHADFIHAFAPRPYLMLSAVRDFFSITGARDTFEEARRIYALLEAPEKLDKVEADDGHGYTKPRRLAAYDWFSRWLKGAGDRAEEPEVQLATESELWCTTTGQVATSLGGESVFTLNWKRVEALKAQRAPGRDLAARLGRLIGFEQPQGAVRVRPYGAFTRPGYRVEKLVYESEPGILIPALLFLPEGGPARKPAVVYVNGAGKAAGMEDLEPLARAGLAVLAMDVRGWGETQPVRDRKGGDFARWFGDFDSGMTALLTGQTLVGMRALDVARGVDVLAGRPEVDGQRIFGYGKGGGSLPVLFAALLEPRLRRVALEDLLASYESITSQRIHREVFEQVAPGILKHGDIPEFVAALAPRPVAVLSTVDPLGQPSRRADREAVAALFR
jgi:cephalosporin-C deacetylase-like acetyl esterase